MTGKVRRRIMLIAAGILVIILCALIVWFKIPYSPVKNQFEKETSALMAENLLPGESDCFTEDDFFEFPYAIQKYIANCGYIGKPKMSYMKMEYHDVDFLQSREGPKLTIDYLQYNFIRKPCRMALIDSSICGIPFEGYDSYKNGTGGMKGVIAKSVTLFDQQGTDMDKACLVTFLAESLFAPAVLLQDYIEFEEINDYEVRGTICCGGETASGVFAFNEQYEMISFSTSDRAAAGTDGSMDYIPWSAICSDYQISENGILHPAVFKAVWHYSDEDFVYFDGIISKITYGYNE